MVKKISVDAHVVHELTHVRALSGNYHLLGGMIDAARRLAPTPTPVR